MPLPDPEVVATVTGWHRQMRDVQRLLTADETSVRLVLTPERVVIAESRRTWTSLSLYGFVVDGVVVNRVFPAADEDAGGGPVDDWRRGWNAAQREGLTQVRESFAGLPVVVSPYLPGEPIGADALFKGTQVDGVYSADPKKDPGATRFDRISHAEVIKRGLSIMDTAAIALARENNIPIIVYSIHEKGGFGEILRGGGHCTVVADE